MARNLKGESEFGLPSPMAVIAPDGSVVDGSSTAGVAAIAAGGLPVASNDAEAIAAGADLDLATQLREVYAKGDGTIGPGKVGNSELRP